MYIISACLMGENCKYNGKNNQNLWVQAFAQDKNVIAVCPEQLGGLPTPRDPSEQMGGRVFSKKGNDITLEFIKGAEASWKVALASAELLGEELQGGILKANSPSCGKGVIYDGSFSGKKISGDGIFAKVLLEKGLPVITEEEEEKKGELL